MKPTGVQLRELSRDLFPLLGRSFIGRGILREAIGTLPVKYRFCGVKLNEFWLLFLGRDTDKQILELFRPKPAVVIADTGSVVKGRAIIIRPEIVFQFLLKRPLAQWIGDLRLLIVGFIHLPGCFQRYAVLLLEHRVAVHHKVIEVVGGPQHGDRDVIVIVAGVFLVDLLTVVGNRAELEVDLLHDCPVFRSWQFVSRWGDVDEPSDQARFGVRNLDGLICADEQKALEAVGVDRLELLIHRHLLVGNQTVQTGIVLNARQFSVMLNGYQRAKRFQRKYITGRPKRLRLKGLVVALKEFLDDVEHRRLTRTGLAIQHHELLELLGLTADNGANSPLNLVTLLRFVESGHQLVIGCRASWFKRIGQFFAGVVLLASVAVGEYQFFVEHMERVPHLLLAILMPCVDHARLGVPQM